MGDASPLSASAAGINADGAITGYYLDAKNERHGYAICGGRYSFHSGDRRRSAHFVGNRIRQLLDTGAKSGHIGSAKSLR